MKKVTFAFLCILFSVGTYAQVDQLTVLKNIPEKTEFVKCEVDWTSEGKLITYPQTPLKILSYKNDDIGNLGSFYLDDNYISKKDADPAQPRPNHPTKPSVFYSTFTGTGSVIIGSFIYELKRNKLDNIVNGNFKISAIYEIKSQDSKEHKKQLKGKSTKLHSTDHYKVIKDYLSSMKVIQEKASSNMSDEDKKKAELTKQAQIEKEKNRMKTVTEDFNKAKQASPTKVAVKNNTTHSICIVVDNMGYSLKAGEQMSFPCNKYIYYGASNGEYCSDEKGEIIVTKNSSCNKVITLD